MNSEVLLQKLLVVARSVVPSERVPFAFEKRIMARLSGRVPTDPWTAWGVWLWRAVAPCCVVMLIVGVSTLALSPRGEENSTQELDAVLLAGLDSGGDNP